MNIHPENIQIEADDVFNEEDIEVLKLCLARAINSDKCILGNIDKNGKIKIEEIDL